MVAFSLRFRPACGKTVADGMDFAVSDINRKKHVTLNINNVMTHKMPELPYAKDALEPHISRETIEYHYGKHLQAYVDNLNKLIPVRSMRMYRWRRLFVGLRGRFFQQRRAGVEPHLLLQYASRRSRRRNRRESCWMRWRRNTVLSIISRPNSRRRLPDLFGSGWTWLVEGRVGCARYRE